MMCLACRIYKKKRGNLLLCLSRSVRPSHCPWLQNKQCRSPRVMDIVRLLYAKHGRRTLRYCGNQMKLRSSIEPQIKRRYNVFFICPVAQPLPLRASGCLTVQNYKDYLNWQKNNAKRMNYSKGCLSAPCLIHRTNCGNNKILWSIAEQI